MPTAIPYLRYSSSAQHKGTSFERQEEMIGDWLVAHPEFTRSSLTYKDLAKSGYKGEHIREGGNFAKLLVAVQSGAIKRGDVVLVEALDRAGRLEVLDMLSKIVSPILEAGVSIITLDDGTEFTKESLNAGGHIYILVGKIQAARQYSETLARRIRSSYDSRRKLAAAGITPERYTPVWLTSKGAVIPEVAAQVRLAFELYVSGLGKAVIARRMRDSGVPALAKCSGPGVDGWLSNEAAIGRWDGAEVYPAIVDLSLFHRARLEAERRKTTPRTKTAVHFLVGLVKCGCCGSNFTMRHLGPLVNMRCRKRQQREECDNARIIPKAVIDAIYHATSVRAARQAVEREFTGVNEHEIAAAEVKLLDISKQMQRVVGTVRAVGDIPELLAELEAVKAERAACERELMLLKSTLVPRLGNGWKQQFAIWKLEGDDPQRLSAMLRGVGYRITVNANKTITTSFTTTVYRFASVDRATGKYMLYAGENLILVPRDTGQPEEYYEPFDTDEVAVSTWTEDDYESLRRQYED